MCLEHGANVNAAADDGLHGHPLRLKYWMARSCFSAAARVSNVPRFLRLPVLASTLREYSRYLPDFSFLII
jgi:hypothetical protein